jgi:hypothetical protein
VSARFEELGWQQTPMGVISLRRRFDVTVSADVFEVKLDDDHLMSSLFTVAERELARLAIGVIASRAGRRVRHVVRRSAR